MAEVKITVVCTGCKKSFSVSSKFAGKQGPCPKCKAIITIPALAEQVVIHEAENLGPKNAAGRPTLKPIFRSETKWNPLVAAGIGVAVLFVLIVAVILRAGIQDKSEFPVVILVLGAIVLAPPLALGGYTFLREDELEPLRGNALYLRVAICALGFCFTWLIPSVVGWAMRADSMDMILILVAAAGMMGLGALASFGSLDLTFGTGALHYAMYLAITALLRIILGLNVVYGPWPLGSA